MYINRVHLLPDQGTARPSHRGRHTVSHTRSNMHTCRGDRRVPIAIYPETAEVGMSPSELKLDNVRTFKRKNWIASSIVSEVKISVTW